MSDLGDGRIVERGEADFYKDLAEALRGLVELFDDLNECMNDFATLLTKIETRLRKLREERADKLIETDQSHLWDTPG